MTVSLERRYVPTEFESRVKGDSLVIEGYAYKFDERSQNLGGFVERIREGAGAEASKTDDIRALFNHDPSLILGRNKSGTLRVGEDSTGLQYETTADMRQSYTKDLAHALERGDVNQSSFGMAVSDDEWGWTEDEFPLRSVLKMGLFDVSPVTFPAYTSSTSGLGKRAIEQFYESRGISPSDMSLIEAIRGKTAEPLPEYDFYGNADIEDAQRFIFL